LKTLATKYPNNDTIANNLGVSYRRAKKYDLAEENLVKAQKAGLNEKNNLGILYINTAHYDEATSTFEGDRCDYNSALAYTMAGNYDEAQKRIECKADKTGWDFYLRAIIGARKGDKSLVTTSLTRAISMDSKFRDMAKNDLEFRKYFDDPEFKNAIR
jgi:tetratricopeptide (TPR) repeat protein